MRAVAVLAVVLFHADVPGVGGGFVGVDVFFVVSGFLITGLLWREVSKTGTVTLRRFYGARARRLLPASATVIVVTVIASAILLPALDFQGVLMDGFASALYVGNYWFIYQGVDYFGRDVSHSPFQHYWSLGVEEQFYLVWPVLIVGIALPARLIRRMRRRPTADGHPSKTPHLVVLALVAVVSFALSLMITYVVPAMAFFSLPTRAWQLAVGGLVALTAGRWGRLPVRAAVPMGWGGLALIVVACTEIGPNTTYPGAAALLPVTGAVLVIGAGCATATQGCSRVLATPPMTSIGRLSYSWYLWHWPVMVLAPALFGPLGLVDRLVAVLVSAGLAVLALRLIEDPVRFAAPVRRSAFASLAVGGLASSVAAGLCAVMFVQSSSWATIVARGAPGATPAITAAPVVTGDNVEAHEAAVQYAIAQVQAAVAASADLEAVPSNLKPSLGAAAAEYAQLRFDGCLRLPSEGGQPECASGNTASATRVVLVGDSHAGMLIPAFRQIAEQRSWRVETLAKAGCPLLDLPLVTNPFFNRLVELVNRCEQWRANIMARLHAERPQLIVLDMFRGYVANARGGWRTSFTSYDTAWLDSLTRLVRQLRDLGSKVLVLGPVPNLNNTLVPQCLLRNIDDATACAPPMSVAVNRSGIGAEFAATKAGGGQYADITELFCTRNRCPVIVGDTLVYMDQFHLTIEYSRVLAPAIGTLVDRAFAHG
ncbi:acyltransferase [Mycobacterium bourgelatii]|uniref:Acyltransferase n=1 Tax=Mycobacterium bourgelatii TaxID=1273442 RepID=A0A7I9YHQ5_MYCBU|nr:acyltransferase [Mycobacterium bourgelatii]